MRDFGLIGHPLAQSFSKIYFENKFTQENIDDASFHLFDLESIDDLKAVLVAHPDLKGFAVTIPYKQALIKYLHKISDETKSIGAVNCVKIDQGILTGYNTDVVGFAASFLPMLKQAQNKALVLGTGGASKAVQYVLKQNKIPFQLVSREAGKSFITYEEVDEKIMRDHNIIINCTPLGMWPNIESLPPLPYEYANEDHIFYDLVYKPEETVFLKKGKEKGATIANGFDMLIAQAEKNWEIWNG